MKDMERLQSIAPKLVAWYTENARPLPWRCDRDPYRVWISEIMLQQTRIEAVKPYFERFIDQLPTVSDLAACEEDQLMKLWEGLGYYSRARNLHKAAKQIVKEHGASLPASYDDLLSLPGIGEYTAAAIASIAFEVPAVTVDGNVLRVISRILEKAEPVNDPAVRKRYTALLGEVIPKGTPGEFNQGMMELGETICIPNGIPKCADCPIAEHCLANKNGTQDKYPVILPKKARRIEEKTVLLIYADDKIAIRKRTEKGLLAKMWEFPNLEGTVTAEAAAKEFGLELISAEALPKAKHIFTHIEWHMTGLRLTVSKPIETDNWQWVDKSDIDTHYAIPTAFKKYKELI